MQYTQTWVAHYQKSPIYCPKIRHICQLNSVQNRYCYSRGGPGKAPPGAGPESLAGAKAPPGAGPKKLAGAKAPPGAGPEKLAGAKAPPGAGPENFAGACAPPGPTPGPGDPWIYANFKVVLQIYVVF